MKRLMLILVLSVASAACQDKPNPIRETESEKEAEVVPKECLAQLRSFIAYISRRSPDIAEDQQSQERFLSQALKKLLLVHLEECRSYQKRNPEDLVEFPDNQTFLRFWDSPTTYKVLGSRRYGKRAIVDVEFAWGKGTNYEGDKEVVSYAFLLEVEDWKLDDIYTLNGKASSGSCLTEQLRQKPL